MGESASAKAAKRKWLTSEKGKQTIKAWRDRNREKLRAREREFYAADGGVRARKTHLARKYGITPETFEEMLVAQGGVCAICFQNKGRTRSGNVMLVVDHNHETGAVRGLLCRNCNSAIGLLSDSPMHVKSALDYLTRGGR